MRRYIRSRHYKYSKYTENFVVQQGNSLRLTDSFPSRDDYAGERLDGSNPESAIEVTATMININEEIGDELLKKSRKLHEYSIFVHKVRGKIEAGITADEAIHATVDECINEDILSEVLLKHKSEVFEMIITEYNAAEHEMLIRKEAHAEGIAQGKAEGEANKAKEIAQNLLRKGMPPSQVCEATGLTETEVLQLK